jgi:hypothetical protein
VDIKLCPLRKETEVANFFELLETTRFEAKEIVEARIDGKKKILDGKAKGFESEARTFLQERNKSAHKTAPWFQKEIREQIRENAKKYVDKVKPTISKESNPLKMAIPEGKFLAEIPDFLPAAIEQVAANEGDAATSINELECRTFMVNLLLGQTLDHAQKMAEKLYDEAFAKVLDDVGGWFFMDGSQFLEELNHFCQNQDPANQEDDLKEFLSRQHFIHMFTGCTLWNIMPMIYTLILPTLWEKTATKQSITSTMYDHNLGRILEILTDNLKQSGS